MVAALQSKEVLALSRPLPGRERDPCGSWPGLELRAHDSSWHLVSFSCLVCFSFVSLTYVSTPSGFPCDFYSQMVRDNFPFHRPAWLLGSFSSADIYDAETYRRHRSSLVQFSCQSQSQSHATGCPYSLPRGTSASCVALYFACVLILFSSALTNCITHGI